MDNFTRNLYIIYTDESKNFSYPSGTSYSISSILVPFDYYKNTLEPDWNNLKTKYNIAEGVCLHFTDIKALLNPKYFSRDIKKRNLAMEGIFCTNSVLDKTLLYNFYSDILTFIKEHDFDIITTNFLKDDRYQFDPHIESTHINSPWYILFKNHLNDLTSYALREKYIFKYKNGSAKIDKANLNFKAKIRYDGDFGLTNRDDIRDAFSHSITTGTDIFNSKTIRNCFDELRFINKTEVGYCCRCSSLPSCSNKNFSHAGNELIDFIATYTGRCLSKNDFLNYFNISFPKKDALRAYNNSITLLIDDRQLEPLNVIKEKLYSK